METDGQIHGRTDRYLIRQTINKTWKKRDGQKNRQTDSQQDIQKERTQTYR